MIFTAPEHLLKQRWKKDFITNSGTSFVDSSIPHQNTTERLLTEYREQNQNKLFLESLKDMTYPMKTTIKIVAGIGKNKSPLFSYKYL